MTYSRSHQLSEVVLFSYPWSREWLPSSAVYWDHPGCFKHCLASASKMFWFNSIRYNLGNRIVALKSPGDCNVQPSLGMNELGKIRISQDTFVYKIMPHTSFPSLSKGVSVWEETGHRGKDRVAVTDPQTLCLGGMRKGGFHVSETYILKKLHRWF